MAKYVNIVVFDEHPTWVVGPIKVLQFFALTDPKGDMSATLTVSGTMPNRKDFTGNMKTDNIYAILIYAPDPEKAEETARKLQEVLKE